MERMAKVIGGLAVVLVVFLLVIRAGRPARREAVPAPPEQEIKFAEVPGEVAEGLFEDEEKLEERMPAEGEAFASEELPGAQEDAGPAPLSHEVKWRETLGHIANRYDTTVSAICEANRIKDPHRIMPGQTLLIPRKAPPVKRPAFELVGEEPAAPKSGDRDIYVVQDGDSLWEIARKHRVTVNALKELNNLRTDLLMPGQQLRIPRKSPVRESSG